MPLPPSRPRSGPRRRTLLASAAGTAAALLAACSTGSSPGRPAARPTPSADELALTRAAADSTGLAALHDAVLAAHPGLAARLTPLRDTALRHAEVLAERAGAKASPSRSAPSPSPSAPAPSVSASGAAAPSVSGPAVPREEKQALRMVADAERDLAGRRTRELSGLGGEPARLLASVAAAGAVHVYLLSDD
ncbi:hypothetical protein [Streptomyces sp. NPDC056600]|uniref:hypothetical protein n=1 Tax=Streptomyces sp. NPDC056600 TaxID=3345874 RepID=UPI003674CF10